MKNQFFKTKLQRTISVIVAVLMMQGTISAATHGANGSGKTVLMKMRRDFAEAVIRKDINDKLSKKISISAPIPDRDYIEQFTANLRVTQLYMGRNLSYGNNQPYKVALFVKLENILGSSDELTRYANQYLAGYSITDKYGDVLKEEFKDSWFLPQIYVEGEFISDDKKEFWTFQISKVIMKKLPEKHSVHHDELEETVLEYFTQNEIKINFNMFRQADTTIEGISVGSGYDTVYDLSSPENFKKDSAVFGMDLYTSVGNISFSNGGITTEHMEPLDDQNTILEFRLAENVWEKIIKYKVERLSSGSTLEEVKVVIPLEDGTPYYTSSDEKKNLPQLYAKVKAKVDIPWPGRDCHFTSHVYYTLEKDSIDLNKYHLQFNREGLHFKKDKGTCGSIAETGREKVLDKLDNDYPELEIISVQSLISFPEDFVEALSYNEGIEYVLLPEVKLERKKNSNGDNVYGDFVITYKNPTFPYDYNKSIYKNYSKSIYMAPYYWLSENKDLDELKNIDDFCNLSWKNECDKDGDLLRDDLDSKVYYSLGRGELHEDVTGTSGKTFETESAGKGGRWEIWNWFETTKNGYEIDLSGTVGIKNHWNGPEDDDSTYLSSYYCYCGKAQGSQLADCKVENGACGLNHAKPNKVKNEELLLPNNQIPNTWRPVNKSQNVKIRVEYEEGKSRDDYHDKYTDAYEKKFSNTWNWREAVKEYAGEIPPVYSSVEAKDDAFRNGQYYGSRISFAPVRSAGHSTYLAGEKINPELFENSMIIGDDYINYNYFNMTADDYYAYSPKKAINLISWDETKSRRIKVFRPYHWHQYFEYLDHLLPWQWLVGPGDPPPGINPMKPNIAVDIKIGKNSLKLEKIILPEDYQQILKGKNGYMALVKKGTRYFIDKADIANNFSNNLKAVLYSPDLNFTASTYMDGQLYVAGSLETEGNHTYYKPVFGKLVEIDLRFEYTALAPIPEDGLIASLKLFTYHGTLLVATVSTDKKMNLYAYSELQDGGSTWMPVFEKQFDTYPSLASLKVVNDNVWFTVVSENGTDLYTITPQGGIQLYTQLDTERHTAVKISEDKFSKLQIASLENVTNGEAVIFTVDNGSVLKENISVSEITTTQHTKFYYGANDIYGNTLWYEGIYDESKDVFQCVNEGYAWRICSDTPDVDLFDSNNTLCCIVREGLTGNEILEPGEQCDLGILNGVDNSGCSLDGEITPINYCGTEEVSFFDQNTLEWVENGGYIIPGQEIMETIEMCFESTNGMFTVCSDLANSTEFPCCVFPECN